MGGNHWAHAAARNDVLRLIIFEGQVQESHYEMRHKKHIEKKCGNSAKRLRDDNPGNRVMERLHGTLYAGEMHSIAKQHELPCTLRKASRHSTRERFEIKQRNTDNKMPLQNNAVILVNSIAESVAVPRWTQTCQDIVEAFFFSQKKKKRAGDNERIAELTGSRSRR